MCTIGYHRKLNVAFKNRDKNSATDEVIVVKPDIMAVKTEGSNYFSTGTNRHGCTFVSAAVNSPTWTLLASKGKTKEATDQFIKENEGLINPVTVLSRSIMNVDNIDDWLRILLESGIRYMGYNLILCNKDKAVHVELYNTEYQVTWIKDMIVLTNHFRHLNHGPRKLQDYPNSFERLNAAQKEIENFVSIEDVFRMLKPHNLTNEGSFWRKGRFFTVSSSVLDLDTNAIYYTSDVNEDYSRISGHIPPKGAEKIFIEMSRYIDLPTYHKIERGHPFYEEMLDEVNVQVARHYKNFMNEKGRMKTLEIGAGTGLCTLELIKNTFLDLDCLEIDNKCCNILSNKPKAGSYNVIQGDAVEYCKMNTYDLIVSTFAHDHIHYDKRFAFSTNIFNNLKKGGRYVIGGEILPYFSNNMERKRALFKYHNYIIDLALQQDRVQVSELENNALKSGLDMIGDFKRHEIMFKEEMETAGFKLIEAKKIGPHNRNDVGGVFVYIFET